MSSYTFVTQAKHEGLSNLIAAGRKIVAVDIETTGLSVFKDRILTIQLYTPGTPPAIISVDDFEVGALRDMLRPVLEDTNWLKVGHNLQFDYGFIKHHLGLDINRLFDTMIAEQLLTAGLYEDADLASVVERYTGRKMDKLIRREFIGKTNSAFTSAQLQYMADDVLVLPELMMQQQRRLIQEGLVEVARLEFAVLPSLVHAHLRGVKINPEAWKEHVEYLKVEANRIEVELVQEFQPYIDTWRLRKHEHEMHEYNQKMAEYMMLAGEREAACEAMHQQFLVETSSKGEARRKLNEWKKSYPPVPKPPKPAYGEGPINLGSPQQLAGVLEELKVPLPRNKNGNLETGKPILSLIAGDYPEVEKLLEWRGYAKLVQSFGDNILAMLDEDNRLHPQFRQLVSTGRMACTSPNIQQVPANAIGSQFRRCIIAPEGYKIYSGDYSNIELRVLAEITGEVSMLTAFDEGQDLHSLTASRMFGVEYDKVKTEFNHLRKIAKIINFGIPYGQGPGGFARGLKISVAQAKEYIKSYFRTNPHIDHWLKMTARNGLLNGYSSTMLGRKRYFPPLNPMLPEYQGLRKSHERMICNHPIQGTSADITKQAVVFIREAIAKSGLDAHPVMFIHDEIVIEVKAEQAEELAVLVEREMIRAAECFLHRVKVEVGYEINDYWVH